MTDMKTPIVVWTEIPVTDLERACAFYAAVFGWKMRIDTTGPNPMADFNDATDVAGGHLYPGTPGHGPTVHFGVADSVEAAAARVVAAGGRVEGPVIPIPAGRFQYAYDLDGNSIGLFEATAAAAA